MKQATEKEVKHDFRPGDRVYVPEEGVHGVITSLGDDRVDGPSIMVWWDDGIGARVHHTEIERELPF